MSDLQIQDFDAPQRGCGFRKKGKFYFYADGVVDRSDFFSKPLRCQCGIQHTRLSRNVQKFCPTDLWPFLAKIDGHDPMYLGLSFVKDEPAYICTVDAKNYPTTEVFTEEAKRLGVSRLIPTGMPKGFKPGQRLFLIHKKGHTNESGAKEPGFFMACTPIVQYVVRGDESHDLLMSYQNKGIKLIRVSNSI